MRFYAKNGRLAEFNIRQAAGADFDGVTDCMQAVFEGNYLNPAVFERGYLESRTKNEDYRLFVAVTPDGTVAANIGLYGHPWFLGCRELCMLAVRPEYRGFGLSRMLIRHLTRISESLGCDMNFATVATHLTASQEAFERNGFIPCGFWFSELDQTKQAADFNHATCKLTSAVYVKPARIMPRRVYIPQDLAAAGQVFKSMGLPMEIESAATTESPPVSELAFYPNEYHHTCYIIAESCGRDIYEAMESGLSPFGKEPAYTFVLMLNIGDSTALEGYQILSRMGFVFAGFLPVFPGRDYMILCNSRVEPFRERELKLTDATRSLLDETLRLQENGVKLQ